MKSSAIEQWAQNIQQWLWEGEAAGKTKTTKFFWHSARIAFAVIRDLIYGNITLHATALVYTTLLSIIPLLAFSFAVLKGLGFHNRVEPVLENILEPLGAQREEIIQKILDFVERIDLAVLGAVLIAILIYTVLSMIQKIERSFNSIWRVSNMRTFAQRFSNYLSVILIGPLVIFTVLGATVDGIRRVISEDQFTWFYTLFNQLTPFLMIIGLSSFLYIFMPNTKVKVKHALIGGIVTGVLWQSISRVFAFYVGNANYENIYPGFAVAILFLFWVYLIWLILLVGASVTFYAQHAHQITKDINSPPSATIDEHTGLALLYRVAKHFDEGRGGVSVMEMESTLSVGPETIQRIIKKLTENNILTFTNDDEQLIPAQSIDKIALKDVLQILRQSESPLPASITANRAVTDLLEKVDGMFDTIGENKSVADWVRQ